MVNDEYLAGIDDRGNVYRLDEPEDKRIEFGFPLTKDRHDALLAERDKLQKEVKLLREVVEVANQAFGHFQRLNMTDGLIAELYDALTAAGYGRD